MAFQRYRGHKRLIGYSVSKVAMKAALIAGVVFLASMDDMKAALTRRAECLTSMANIKVGLKSGESEKGAIMKQTPPLKKIKGLLLVRRTPFLETERKRWPVGMLAMPSASG